MAIDISSYIDRNSVPKKETKIKISAAIGREFVVRSYELLASHYRKGVYIVLHITLGGQRCRLTINSNLMKDELDVITGILASLPEDADREFKCTLEYTEMGLALYSSMWEDPR